MELYKQETILTDNNDADIQEKLWKINIIELMKSLKATSFWEKGGLTGLIKLIIKLGGKLEEYETIISDDASGRLVSLTLLKIVNKIRAEYSKDFINTLFVAGGSGIDNRKVSINKVIENNKDKLGKTLLVTDFIQTGESIEQLSKILNKNSIDFDIAAVSIARDPKSNYNKYLKNLFKRLYYGEIGDAGLMFYSRDSFTGVYKNSAAKEVIPEMVNVQGDSMKNVREDIDLIVNKVIEVIK